MMSETKITAVKETNKDKTSEKKIDFIKKYSIIPEQFMDNTQKIIDYENYLKLRNDYINGKKELNDKHILIQNKITWVMNDYGVILYNFGHIDDAKQIWKKSGNLGDPYAYSYLFTHFAFKKNTNKQIYYCEKEIENGNIDRCMCLFNYYYDTKNWKKTDEYMKKYIELGGKKQMFEMISKTNNKRADDANKKVDDINRYTINNVKKTNETIEINFMLLALFALLFTIINICLIIQNCINYNTVENFHGSSVWISCIVNGISVLGSIILMCLFIKYSFKCYQMNIQL